MQTRNKGEKAELNGSHGNNGIADAKSTKFMF